MSSKLYLGSLPKLRELQIAGNPLDYPSRNIIKKGSKYLIKFLQDEWNSNQSKNEISDFNNEVSQIKKADCKTIQRNNINDKNHVILWLFQQYFFLIYYLFLDEYIKNETDGKI